METVYYNLSHEYELNGNTDVTKYIGVFETFEKADQAVDFLIKKDGFREYPRECFQISECYVDSYIGWSTGFITVEEALDENTD